MTNNCEKRNQAGMSMIDVMLAIFIFSIGLLGIAGLEMFSKRANHEAVQRTTAVMLANDIIERMRANPVQATGRNDINMPIQAYLASYEPVQPPATAPVPSCSGSANPCTPDQQALHDLWEWQQAIIGATDLLPDDSPSGGLVQPSACITDPTPADPNNFDIEVAIVWRSQTPMGSLATTPCGTTTGNYGDNNEYRQVFVLKSIINPDT